MRRDTTDHVFGGNDATSSTSHMPYFLAVFTIILALLMECDSCIQVHISHSNVYVFEMGNGGGHAYFDCLTMAALLGPES